MKLVADWRQFHRWYCVHTQAIGCVLSAVAGSLALAGAAAPWFSVFDFGIAMGIFCAIFLAGLVGRLIRQEPRPPRPKKVPK